MRNISRLPGIAAGCVFFVSLAVAQRGGGPAWNTAGGDAQRASWARTDARISATSMPKFQFLWKVKVDNAAKDAYSLSSAVMGGVRELAIDPGGRRPEGNRRPPGSSGLRVRPSLLRR